MAVARAFRFACPLLDGLELRHALTTTKSVSIASGLLLCDSIDQPKIGGWVASFEHLVEETIPLLAIVGLADHGTREHDLREEHRAVGEIECAC